LITWITYERPRLQLLLDVLILSLYAAVFLQLGDPDVVLHSAWLGLVLEAFLFGLRVTAVRIGITIIVIVSYALLSTGAILPLAPGTNVPQPLELSEWSLMLLIASLVAVMADRVGQTSKRYASLYRRASDRLLHARADERTLLALDLHDGVGQTLTALSLTLDAATTALRPPAPLIATAEVVRDLARARELTGSAINETRAVARRLHPPRLHELSLAAAIRGLAVVPGRSVEVMIDPSVDIPGLLDFDAELAAFRIVQEAMTNAARHAGAVGTSVAMKRSRDTLFIEVVDGGPGFDPSVARRRGLGLYGMAERAAMIGAKLRIASAPGRGTRIDLSIPLLGAQREAAVAALERTAQVAGEEA
jgi:signal transduction histidine kinase